MKKVENIYQTDLFDPDKLAKHQSSLNDPIVRSSFTVNRQKLLDALRRQWAHYRYSRDSKYFIKIELIVREDGVVFKTRRAEDQLNCEPVGFCKAQLYYQDLLDAIKGSLKRDVPIVIFERSITVNGVRLTAHTFDYDPASDVVRNTPSLAQVTSEIYDPYAPDRDKNFITKDGSKGFMYTQIFSDAEMIHHYMKKYGAQYNEVYSFVTSFLIPNPKRI
jgi:hypothetical protein